MLHKHFHGQQVRFTQVVNESTHVAIATGIYTVGVRLLQGKRTSDGERRFIVVYYYLHFCIADVTKSVLLMPCHIPTIMQVK